MLPRLKTEDKPGSHGLHFFVSMSQAWLPALMKGTKEREFFVAGSNYDARCTADPFEGNNFTKFV